MTRRRRQRIAQAIRLVAAVLFLALGAGAGHAQTPPEIGQTRQGAVVLLGRSVPLPPGEWTVVGRGYGRVVGDSPGAYGSILGLMLARATDGVVDGVVLVSTNVLPVQQGWGPAPECGDDRLLYVTEIRLQGRNLSCAHVRLEPRPVVAFAARPAGQSGLESLVQRRWRLPEEFVVAGFRVGDRRDVVDVRYGFPTPAALAPGGSDALADDVRGNMLLALMQAWTDLVRPRVDSSLSLAEGEPVALPSPWNRPAVPAAGAAPKEMSVWELSLYKLATNRVMQTGISFGIGYLLTANPYTSGVLALWQSITHAAVYYGNELAWEWPRIPGAMDFVARGARR